MTKSMERKASMYAAIRKHGENLLALFPNAAERDAVELCKKLRRLEAVAYKLSLRACNGPNYDDPEEQERLIEAVLLKVEQLLGFDDLGIPVFINLDARGCALKINDAWMKANPNQLEKDWGGYGLLAPEIKG